MRISDSKATHVGPRCIPPRARTAFRSIRFAWDDVVVSSTGSTLLIRQASGPDALLAVEVLLAARHAAVPAIPPLVHSDPEVRVWFAETVMPAGGVWIAEISSDVVGMMVVDGDWLEQLYVAPRRTGDGNRLGDACCREERSSVNNSICGRSGPTSEPDASTNDMDSWRWLGPTVTTRRDRPTCGIAGSEPDRPRSITRPGCATGGNCPPGRLRVMMGR